MNENMTIQVMRIIGSPFCKKAIDFEFSDEYKKKMFEFSFENRVELLFLRALEALNRLKGLEQEYENLKYRANMTLSVIARASSYLNTHNIPYAVFKSIKPYPATPNDTDILCLGNKNDYKKAFSMFMDNGYKKHEAAPLQINIYDPRGEGKIGPGKKGGIYYIDFYQDIATDYFVYINKEKLLPFVIKQEVEGVHVKVLAHEPELAIVMYHNVFPEKTFHLEHLYLPIYRFADPSFDLQKFKKFVEDNRLTLAVRANLSLIEVFHEKAFGIVPPPVKELLNAWGRAETEIKKLIKTDISAPYYFTVSMFWGAFLSKLPDLRSAKSLINQAIHMLNPRFLFGAVKMMLRRTFGFEKYKHD